MRRAPAWSTTRPTGASRRPRCAGLARAAARGFDGALLVPGDCPLVDAAELDALIEASAGREVVIVPDRHGTGTNALLVDPRGPFEPQFGPGSRERHVEQAERRGLAYAVDQCRRPSGSTSTRARTSSSSFRARATFTGEPPGRGAS